VARALTAQTRRALQDASRGADAVRELLERSLLRTRFFLALRLRFRRGGVAGWIEFGYSRIHDVGSLYDARVRCPVERLKAIDVPRVEHLLGSMTDGGFPSATGDCRSRMLRMRDADCCTFVAACRRDLLQND